MIQPGLALIFDMDGPPCSVSLPSTPAQALHPTTLAGVLRTAIGLASLAGQLAVRSTRAQH